MGGRVLIVEDEPDIRDLLAFHLERDGYQVPASRPGSRPSARSRARRRTSCCSTSCCPSSDGLEVCRRLRQDPRTASLPIVMLTAKGEEVDRVLGLELGADDYIVKPFSPKEVVARVRAVLRRAGPRRRGAVLSGRLVIDARAPHRHGGRPRRSSSRPRSSTSCGRWPRRGAACCRASSCSTACGATPRAGEIESRTVDVHVRRLRVKLGAEGRRIVTVKGVGYRLEVDGMMPRLRFASIRRRIALKLTLTLVGFVAVTILAAGLYLEPRARAVRRRVARAAPGSAAGACSTTRRGASCASGAGPRRRRPSSRAWRARRGRASR